MSVPLRPGKNRVEIYGQYAALMGLNKDLKLKGNEVSNTATIFFAAYLVTEVPTGQSDYYSLCSFMADFAILQHSSSTEFLLESGLGST